MLATAELIAQTNQQYRLAEVLPRWTREIQLYRPWAERMRHAAVMRTPSELLQSLPFLTKADIRRDFPHNFLRSGIELDDLLERELVELEHTSGTSEERTPLLLQRGSWAKQEERALRINGLVGRVLDSHPAARRVGLSSPTCNGDICYRGVPSLDERTLGQTLVASLSRQPFLWSNEELARIADETQTWQPAFLDVAPVYGVRFALYCEQHQIHFPSLQFILCSYEYLSVVHRRILQRVFGVPVFNLYGSTETGHLLMEDEQGKPRASFETAFLEVLAPDAQGVGELIVTTLTNEYMPLLHYRIGDLVEPAAESYGTTYRLHGRAADALALPDGHRVTVGQIEECFQGIAGIAHYQLRQETLERFALWFVPDTNGLNREDEQALLDRLGNLLQTKEQIRLHTSDMLLAQSSGKFRLTHPAQ